MNTHQASELAASREIRELATRLAASYTEDPGDKATARVALLMLAAQREASAWGIKTRVIFDNEGETE